MQELLLSSCAGRAIDDISLPHGLWDAVQANEPTLKHLQSLEAAIAATDPDTRYELYLAFRGAENTQLFLGHSTSIIPDPPDTVAAELKKLAAHLFENTSKLVGVTRACGETVMDHYNRYSSDLPPGNGNVCGMCATELLAQRQHHIAAQYQWRAPYDHLLAKDKYPQFGVDPSNLLPTCHTCNSKAKLAKDLIRDTAGVRRACFNPWIENAHGQVVLDVEFLDISPLATWSIIPVDHVSQKKLTTWNEVYKIKERIEGEFLSLREKLAEDLDLEDLHTFKVSIERRAKIYMRYARLTPFNYWRGLLYNSLLKMPDQPLERLRTLCLEGLNSGGDAAATYGI
ncbi:hypothetical protein ACI2KE_18125 [Pseudomonas monteilii]